MSKSPASAAPQEMPGRGQGAGLLGTTAVPGLLEAGPRKNTRFFFILNARL